MAVLNQFLKSVHHYMNQHSPSTLRIFSVNRALEVELCSSTDFLPQCGFFFFKSEISESKATLCVQD